MVSQDLTVCRLAIHQLRRSFPLVNINLLTSDLANRHITIRGQEINTHWCTSGDVDDWLHWLILANAYDGKIASLSSEEFQDTSLRWNFPHRALESKPKRLWNNNCQFLPRKWIPYNFWIYFEIEMVIRLLTLNM